MKRTGLLLLLIPIILFSQFGCVTDDSTTLAVDALRKRLNDSDALIATHTTTITQLTAQLAQKATAAEVAAAKADAATALAKANAMTTPPATNYESRIAALESWKTSLGTANPVTPLPPAGGSVTGQVTYTTSITPIQSWGNGQNQNFVVVITNGTNQWKYVRPGFVLETPLPGAAINAENLKIMMQCGSAMFSDTDFLFTPALSVPPAAIARTSIDAAPYSGGENLQGQLYIGPGQVKNCSVTLTTTSIPNNALWSVSVNLRTSQ
jgi:hypothetical protein